MESGELELLLKSILLLEQGLGEHFLERDAVHSRSLQKQCTQIRYNIPSNESGRAKQPHLLVRLVGVLPLGVHVAPYNLSGYREWECHWCGCAQLSEPSNSRISSSIHRAGHQRVSGHRRWLENKICLEIQLGHAVIQLIHERSGAESSRRTPTPSRHGQSRVVDLSNADKS